MCRDDAMRLDTLVRDLLDLSRIESGEERHSWTSVRVADLLTRRRTPLRRQAAAKGLTSAGDRADRTAGRHRGPQPGGARGGHLVTNADPGHRHRRRIDVAARLARATVAIAVTRYGTRDPARLSGRGFRALRAGSRRTCRRRRARSLDLPRASSRRTRGRYRPIGTRTGHDVHVHAAMAAPVTAELRGRGDA